MNFKNTRAKKILQIPQSKQNMNISKKRLRMLLAGLLLLLPLKTANAAPSSVTYLPNQHGKSLTTPVAWGASGNVVFMGIGGSIPDPYTSKSDGAAVFGAGFGDPKKNIGVQASVTCLDISDWKRYSASAQLFRELGNANAIAAGIENVMLSNGGDADHSLYVVYSQSIQAQPFIDSETGVSKLHYSIGAGTGRFGNKSEADINSGKGKHGTYVFANVAYAVADEFNLISDWNGLNLNAGVAKTFKIGKVPIVATVGAADLTNNSGDRVRMIVAVGTGFNIN